MEKILVNGNEVVEYSFWAECNVAKEAFLLRNGSELGFSP